MTSFLEGCEAYQVDVHFGVLLKKYPHQAERMDAMAERFGVPDVHALAKSYEHPVH
jgi:hypothetical protein